MKLTFIFTALLGLLVGCAESTSPPVFSDVPGMPPEAPQRQAQAATPAGASIGINGDLAGASIDTNGIITWTPNQNQTPSTKAAPPETLLAAPKQSEGGSKTLSEPAAPPAQPPSPVASAPQATSSEPGLYIFTFGAFKHPGRFAWTNGMTLQDGIQAAGGLDESARRRLLLYHEEGLAERIPLARDKSLTSNPVLKPGDKIVSPQ